MSHYMYKYINSLQNYSIGNQMLALVVVWTRHTALSRVVQCVSVEGLWRPWFLLFPLLSLLGIRVRSPKLKGVLSFCFCIKFGLHYFYCYLFSFEFFFWLIFFSISARNIWFYLFFIPNSIFILLIAFFLIFNCFFFNFIS
jgi:hypothetical protein